jgi:hypothetical protein
LPISLAGVYGWLEPYGPFAKDRLDSTGQGFSKLRKAIFRPLEEIVLPIVKVNIFQVDIFYAPNHSFSQAHRKARF